MENRKCPQMAPLPRSAVPASHLCGLRGWVDTSLWARTFVPSPEVPVKPWLEHAPLGSLWSSSAPHLALKCCLLLPPALPLSAMVTVSTLVLLQLLIGDPQTSHTSFLQLCPGLTPTHLACPALRGLAIEAPASFSLETCQFQGFILVGLLF